MTASARRVADFRVFTVLSSNVLLQLLINRRCPHYPVRGSDTYSPARQVSPGPPDWGDRHQRCGTPGDAAGGGGGGGGILGRHGVQYRGCRRLPPPRCRSDRRIEQRVFKGNRWNTWFCVNQGDLLVVPAANAETVGGETWSARRACRRYSRCCAKPMSRRPATGPAAKANQERLASGDVNRVAEVVRDCGVATKTVACPPVRSACWPRRGWCLSASLPWRMASTTRLMRRCSGWRRPSSGTVRRPLLLRRRCHRRGCPRSIDLDDELGEDDE